MCVCVCACVGGVWGLDCFPLLLRELVGEVTFADVNSSGHAVTSSLLPQFCTQLDRTLLGVSWVTHSDQQPIEQLVRCYMYIICLALQTAVEFG